MRARQGVGKENDTQTYPTNEAKRDLQVLQTNPEASNKLNQRKIARQLNANRKKRG